jgi:hypothetical protein
MAWDASGNLWVARNSLTDHPHDGIFTFDPNGKPLYFTPDPNGIPFGLAIAPATDPSHPNNIIVANLAGNVPRIDPASCHGTVTAPGICTLSSFISAAQFSGQPKYPAYYTSCPNPDLNGHVEICKASDPAHPVSGTFDFTATAAFFSSGMIQVPVGYCSGPVEVPAANPSGTVTITETPTIGDLVSSVTAYSYDQQGFYVNQLESWTEPDLYATVGVVPGDVSLETLAIFTNYAASPGQLKICKIAGQGVPVGTGPFRFTVTAPQGYRQTYMIDAGPPDQGGYCELAGTFAANTPVTVTENLTLTSPYKVSNIAVACNACTYTIQIPSVNTTIGAGITEVDFTNVPKPGIR